VKIKKGGERNGFCDDTHEGHLWGVRERKAKVARFFSYLALPPPPACRSPPQARAKSLQVPHKALRVCHRRSRSHQQHRYPRLPRHRAHPSCSPQCTDHSRWAEDSAAAAAVVVTRSCCCCMCACVLCVCVCFCVCVCVC
jgi:hypothetical protein